MAVEFSIEVPTRKLVGEIYQMAKEFWHDYRLNTDWGVKLDFDEEAIMVYKDYAIIIAGRDETGKLVAVYAGFVQPYLYSKELMRAEELVWCIAEEHRNTRMCARLIKAIELAMEAKDINIWNLAVPYKKKHKNLCKALERLGYKGHDINFSKVRT